MCMDSLRPCFTIVEAAQFFQFSRTLLDKLIHDHRIRTVKIGKRTIVRPSRSNASSISSKLG